MEILIRHLLLSMLASIVFLIPARILGKFAPAQPLVRYGTPAVLLGILAVFVFCRSTLLEYSLFGFSPVMFLGYSVILALAVIVTALFPKKTSYVLDIIVLFSGTGYYLLAALEYQTFVHVLTAVLFSTALFFSILGTTATSHYHTANSHEERKNSMTSPKKSAMPAKKRGMIGAAIGFIVFLVLALFSDGTNLTMQIIYMIAGAFYGFGFTFANWKIVMEETKKGAIEGAAGLGIGIILSKLFDNKNWGIFGWLFFLFRISWHLGFCWIPGIAYGIRLIREEAVQEQKVSSAVSPKPAPVHAPGSVSNPTPVPASPPTLRCTNGIFSGAEIPLQTGEEILIGSDAALCQLVLPADYAAPVQCQIRFDTAQNRWLVKDLSGGNTFINGIFPIQSPDYQPIASGVALCIGQGKNCQRFQLG